MVPFSFPQPLLKSRVMKERSLPSVTLDPIGGERESLEEREGCEGGLAKPHLTLDTWHLTPGRVQGKSSLGSQPNPQNQGKSR
jgi:hypothetical protein